MIALYVKTWRDHWRTLFAWSLTLITLISIQMSIYPSISENKEALQGFLESYPEAIRKIFRMQDYTSGPGFLSTELYSMMIPLVLIAVGGTWGAAATAEEEDEGTADLLLTLPISRSRILISKMFAAISVVIVLAFLGLLNVIVLRGVVDMEIETAKLLAGTISSIAIGLFFTGVAFLIGAHSRSKGVAIGVVTGVALITFLIYSLSALVDDFDSIMPYNPMQWGLSGMPLFEGVDVLGSLKLVAGGLVAMIWAIMKFDRKDISTP
jgi:ABC-2 type transport system permease protein